MTEHLLNEFYGHPCIKQPCGDSMTQEMGIDPFYDSGRFGCLCNHLLNTPGTILTAAWTLKDWPSVAHANVQTQFAGQALRDRHFTLLVARGIFRSCG